MHFQRVIKQDIKQDLRIGAEHTMQRHRVVLHVTSNVKQYP